MFHHKYNTFIGVDVFAFYWNSDFFHCHYFTFNFLVIEMSVYTTSAVDKSGMKI